MVNKITNNHGRDNMCLIIWHNYNLLVLLLFEYHFLLWKTSDLRRLHAPYQCNDKSTEQLDHHMGIIIMAHALVLTERTL